MMEPEQQERMEREQEEGDIRHEDLCQGCGCYRRSEIWHTCSDCKRSSCQECADAGLIPCAVVVVPTSRKNY